MKYQNRVRELRESRGWSQRDLAAKLGLSPGAVALWENGTNLISATNAFALADLFGCTLDTIYDRADAVHTPA